MQTAAPSKMELYNRKYLALRRQIDQETGHFRYPGTLIEEMTLLRNTILEMQSANRKGGEAR